MSKSENTMRRPVSVATLALLFFANLGSAGDLPFRINEKRGHVVKARGEDVGSQSRYAYVGAPYESGPDEQPAGDAHRDISFRLEGEQGTVMYKEKTDVISRPLAGRGQRTLTDGTHRLPCYAYEELDANGKGTGLYWFLAIEGTGHDQKFFDVYMSNLKGNKKLLPVTFCVRGPLQK
jgi:hypothetical protein